MSRFGNTLEEFIQDFKERVVSNAACWYPKDYRKSDEYLDRDIDEKFDIALNSSWIRSALIDTIESYYNELKEYEEELGY